MGLIEHAKLELQMAGLFDKEGDFYEGMTGEAVMELIEVFAKQGHSGMSASIVLNLFKRLGNYETLLPLTGKDEEWTHLGYSDALAYQNKRNSAVFKHANGTCTYNDDIIMKTQKGTTWTGALYLTREDAIEGKNRIKSGTIKSFPFTPKTFYIDVIEEEIEKDNWIMWCKDPSQLDEVWEYYQKPEGLN